MTRIITLCVLALTLSACVTERSTVVEFYSKADIDAVNARNQCRALARTLVQIERCDAR